MKVLSTFLGDLLYPPKCGICGKLGARGTCKQCESNFKPVTDIIPAISPIHKIHSLYLYEDEAAIAVQRLKFDRITSLAQPMSNLLVKASEKIEFDVIIPVPISKSRRSERGFNQSELLTQCFAKNKVNKHLLKRIRYTRPQLGLSATERRQNLVGAFKADPRVKDLKILLLDDVLTTGGTAIACTDELLNQGASTVEVLTFAYQPKPES